MACLAKAMFWCRREGREPGRWCGSSCPVGDCTVSGAISTPEFGVEVEVEIESAARLSEDGEVEIATGAVGADG